MMLEVVMAVFTNTSAKSIETRHWLYDKANHTEVAYHLSSVVQHSWGINNFINAKQAPGIVVEMCHHSNIRDLSEVPQSNLQVFWKKKDTFKRDCTQNA